MGERGRSVLQSVFQTGPRKPSLRSGSCAVQPRTTPLSHIIVHSRTVGKMVALR